VRHRFIVDYLDKIYDCLCVRRKTGIFLSKSYIPYLTHLPEVETDMYMVRKYPWLAWESAKQVQQVYSDFDPSDFFTSTEPLLFGTYPEGRINPWYSKETVDTLFARYKGFSEARSLLDEVVSLEKKFFNLTISNKYVLPRLEKLGKTDYKVAAKIERKVAVKIERSVTAEAN
jgi:hypothetical protein